MGKLRCGKISSIFLALPVLRYVVLRCQLPMTLTFMVKSAVRGPDILKISLSGNFWKSMLEFSTRKEPVVLRLFSLFTPWRVLVSKSDKQKTNDRKPEHCNLKWEQKKKNQTTKESQTIAKISNIATLVPQLFTFAHFPFLSSLPSAFCLCSNLGLLAHIPLLTHKVMF